MATTGIGFATVAGGAAMFEIVTSCALCSPPDNQQRLVGRRHNCPGVGGAEVVMWRDEEPWVVLDGPRPPDEQPSPCFHKVSTGVTILRGGQAI